jgi:crotonobetaine/carnitine-CoA ligase
LFSGLPDPARWSLPAALAEHAARQPEALWVTTTEGETLTFGQAAADAAKVAGWLEALGVERGATVAVMMGSTLDFIRVWLGLQYRGAVGVLLNTELSGAFLEHQLANCGCAFAIADATLAPRVVAAAPQAPALRRVAVVGRQGVPAATVDCGALEPVDFAAWHQATPAVPSVPAGHDIACIMYTSGTSGPAKGVLMPYRHCALYGIGTIKSLELTAADRYYITLPLFHVNGLFMQLGATLLAGIVAIVRERFSATEWLNDVRRHGATVSNNLGALAAFVAATPAAANDREHALRVVQNAPNVPELERVFRERFGVPHVTSGFGMTEVNIPIWGRVGRSTPGAAGWVHEEHFEVIIADPETDLPVPRGNLGEILVRPRIAGGFMAGYHGMPDKTVEAWRNLWFHTGDAGIMDATGLVTFVDRLKDCIRRRGENIAANEVEFAVAGLPGVAEVAAFAVPSDLLGGEDELMLAVVPVPGSSFDPLAFAAAAEQLLPRFARPRYVEVLEALPKTATGKVQRAVLRKRGSGSAIDRGEPQRRGKTS